jgi:hypothetical protein
VKRLFAFNGRAATNPQSQMEPYGDLLRYVRYLNSGDVGTEMEERVMRAYKRGEGEWGDEVASLLLGASKYRSDGVGGVRSVMRVGYRRCVGVAGDSDGHYMRHACVEEILSPTRRCAGCKRLQRGRTRYERDLNSGLRGVLKTIECKDCGSTAEVSALRGWDVCYMCRRERGRLRERAKRDGRSVISSRLMRGEVIKAQMCVPGLEEFTPREPGGCTDTQIAEWHDGGRIRVVDSRSAVCGGWIIRGVVDPADSRRVYRSGVCGPKTATLISDGCEEVFVEVGGESGRVIVQGCKGCGNLLESIYRRRRCAECRGRSLS